VHTYHIWPVSKHKKKKENAVLVFQSINSIPFHSKTSKGESVSPMRFTSQVANVSTLFSSSLIYFLLFLYLCPPPGCNEKREKITMKK
jgi:hypothetical protein